ncbi:MAG: glycosyltransferase family 2 protein [Pelagibacterales bacterium]|nr:glycosyltransferase family 2 protein [Pelagibacterales bacterium]
MTKISAVIVAHNEERKIEGCLKSLDFADEIVVVLDKCSDSTKEIVLKYTNKIIEGSWNIEGARRNVALAAATCDFILEIDADERISPALATEIRQAIAKEKNKAFIVPIANYVGARYVKFGWLRTLGVLQRQTIHAKGCKKYHEDKEIHPTFDLNAPNVTLKNPITHLVDDNIADLLNRFNRYTNWRANDMIARNKMQGCFFKNLIGFKMRFIKSFFIAKGYKEGLLGFLIAVLTGLYPIVSYLKAKEKNENN